jgi:hypothetical protein
VRKPHFKTPFIHEGAFSLLCWLWLPLHSGNIFEAKGKASGHFTGHIIQSGDFAAILAAKSLETVITLYIVSL